MSNQSSEDRRHFVKHVAAAAAITAIGAARTVTAEPLQLAKATDAPKPGMATPPSKAVMLDRGGMTKLSSKLYASPAERQKFLANPEMYASEVLGGKVQDTRKLQQIKEMISEGFCCGGCGC